MDSSGTRVACTFGEHASRPRGTHCEWLRSGRSHFMSCDAPTPSVPGGVASSRVSLAKCETCPTEGSSSSRVFQDRRAAEQGVEADERGARDGRSQLDSSAGPMKREMEPLAERIQRAVREEIAISPYDPSWPDSFRREEEHLRSCLPNELIGRIEHFGSTAVPGLAAKPIVDMLVEVSDLQAARERIAPVLEGQGYDYFWRPTHGDDGPPFYAWFIKREPRSGARTHHIHMVERHFSEHWDRLLFRDYLIDHPEVAKEYERLKVRLASVMTQDRVGYTRAKTEFIVRMTEQARRDHARA